MAKRRVTLNNNIKPANKFSEGSVRVVNLSGYAAPEVKEVYGKDWVQYGENNDYFDQLIERYLGSPTNSGCINGIVEMIYGRGLDATDSDVKPEMYAKMKLLLKPREVKKVVNDYKMLGQASMQVIYNKEKTKIIQVLHFPMETLRAEKATDGQIKAYYYHPKWCDIKPSDKPKRIPTFGNGSKSDVIEMFVIKPYKSGFYYYAPVDYNGCLQYCSLEEEVSNYHINNIKNGLQPSLLINFNNGVPNEETQELLESKIYDKFSGTSNAGKFILTFNDSAETKADLEPIHLPDAHAQYQFLSTESREKIMMGHRIVSPILMGIKDNTGFGNNAEELRTASIIMDNVVIRPFQQSLIEGFEEILNFNGIFLNLYFITLQPIEFTELDNISTKVRKEEETGEKQSENLSSQEECLMDDFSDEQGEDLYSQLEELGEVVSNEWELVDTQVLDGTESSLEELKTTLASVSKDDAKPNKDSKQDNAGFKVRYAYAPVRKSSGSRTFCKKMEALTEKNIVFRSEDVTVMSFRGINKELGHKGQNYSLFKFKGGKNCKHLWERRVYKKKVGVDTEVEASDAAKEGFVEPNNPKEVSVRPADMKDGGAYPKTKK
jgi:hypothetical protein